MSNQLNCTPPCTELQLMQKDIQQIKKNDERHQLKLDSIELTLSKMHEKLDKNYAGKWVEKFAVAIITVCVVAVVFFIFDFVGLPHR